MPALASPFRGCSPRCPPALFPRFPSLLSTSISRPCLPLLRHLPPPSLGFRSPLGLHAPQGPIPLCLIPSSLGTSRLRASVSQGSPLPTLLATPHLHSAASAVSWLPRPLSGPPTSSGPPISISICGRWRLTSCRSICLLPACLGAHPLPAGRQSSRGGGAKGSWKGCPAPRPEQTWPPLQQGPGPG